MKTNPISLCKKAARSFYLTIRLLPYELRESVALAYLLARASDTIADVDKFSYEEEQLVRHLPLLLELLEKRDLIEQGLIYSVWQKILEGQLFEVSHFSSESQQQKVFTSEELDNYLYLVAGCVGEFWTKLSFHFLKNFSHESLEKMIAWGVSYGKGLQLLNILRDRFKDRELGHFYFEEDQFFELCEQTVDYLKQGRNYVRAIKHRRLRYATGLPVLLAEKTLQEILKNRNAKNVKIKKAAVYATLIRALFF